MDSSYDYGLWVFVVINSLIILMFAFSFFRPSTGRDWRTFGAFSAFIVALFAEMYGFPLTIYLLSGWLGTLYPEINLFSHGNGHLWQTILGIKVEAHMAVIHIISNIIILAGFILLSKSWKVLYRAQRNNELAVTGPYSMIRHPQYVAFIIIMLGFLIQWPTLPTLLMFPILALMYSRLARREEKEAFERFGEQYIHYGLKTPKFIPVINLEVYHNT